MFPSCKTEYSDVNRRCGCTSRWPRRPSTARSATTAARPATSCRRCCCRGAPPSTGSAPPAARPRCVTHLIECRQAWRAHSMPLAAVQTGCLLGLLEASSILAAVQAHHCHLPIHSPPCSTRANMQHMCCASLSPLNQVAVTSSCQLCGRIPSSLCRRRRGGSWSSCTP